jgi:acetyl-CoA carboxylase biotin carboxyl carrier protein
VDAGDHVAVGDPVGSIEVMKMYTSVASTISGTVIEICVEDGAFVEHGQVLMYIDPTAN